MMKPILTATALTVAMTGLAAADGSHSHAHTHPHSGHGGSAANPAFQHTHGAAAIGQTHSHEVNGVMLRHSHSTRLRPPGSDEWSRKFAEREARYQSEVGAGFGPYSAAEWHARADAGQPGMTKYQEPWPQPRHRAAHIASPAHAAASASHVATHPGIVSRKDAVSRATTTPTVYQISRNEWVRVVRQGNGTVRVTYSLGSPPA